MEIENNSRLNLLNSFVLTRTFTIDPILNLEQEHFFFFYILYIELNHFGFLFVFLSVCSLSNTVY